MKPELDIAPYIADSDYLVQLSDQRRTDFGYAPCEALYLGVPVITTPVESFKQIGVKDGENGFIVNFSLNNVDIQKIYESSFKFKYTPPETKWGEILTGKSNYTPSSSNLSYECIKSYDDIELKRNIKKGEAVECTKERAKFLKSKGVIK